jgi:transposase InsO family protein
MDREARAASWHSARRGPGRQRRRRDAERSVRRSALALVRWLEGRGWGQEAIAERLGVHADTVAGWDRRWSEDRMRARALGRPVRRSDRETRHAVLALLALLGPQTGVARLQGLLPHVARAELEELVRRYRRVWRTRRGLLLHRLRWERAGAVWAADFTQPPAPLEGCFPALLAVRDLASQNQLAAMPVPDETVRSTIGVLEPFVQWLGAPLVLKLDNGSAFRSAELRAWAEGKGMLPLHSPPQTPEYNGAIEAGIGGLVVRAFHEAARQGRALEWTCEDLEAARRQGNETGRPWGAAGATPDEVWRDRTRLTEAERDAFQATYERRRTEERRARGIPDDVQLQHDERASIDRHAITGALVEHGFLVIRRRRIPLPISRRFSRIIS